VTTALRKNPIPLLIADHRIAGGPYATTQEVRGPYGASGSEATNKSHHRVARSPDVLPSVTAAARAVPPTEELAADVHRLDRLGRSVVLVDQLILPALSARIPRHRTAGLGWLRWAATGCANQPLLRLLLTSDTEGGLLLEPSNPDIGRGRPDIPSPSIRRSHRPPCSEGVDGTVDLCLW